MTPSIYNEVNPAGFDYQVLLMQQKLANLNFVEALFGAAKVQVDLNVDQVTSDKVYIADFGKRGTQRSERWYPMGRKLNQYIDLTFDDTYICRVFFLVKDPISTSPPENKYDWASGNPEIKQPFSIILHANINKVTNLVPSITSTEQLKLSILYSLSQCPKVVVNSMQENIDNVWKEFSMNDSINGFGRYPFYPLRIEADAYYFAYPMNNNKQFYDPSVNYSQQDITPNSTPGYTNVN